MFVSEDRVGAFFMWVVRKENLEGGVVFSH